MQKVVSGFGLLASGMVLWAAGFPNDAVPGKVAPAIIDRFLSIYIPLDIVLFLIGLAVMWSFPITRASHRETLKTPRRRSGPSCTAGANLVSFRHGRA